MLSLQSVSYRYAGATRDSLSDVSLELADGTVTGLLGATEAGKSTLCLVLAGLAPRVLGGDLRGRLIIDGQDASVEPMHRLAGPVVIGLQSPAAQLSMVADTVFDEVAFGPANLGLPRDEVIELTEQTLEVLDLRALSTRDPRRLSGGQQQLVVLGGLLAMRPRHLILDEPTAHLDAGATDLVIDAISSIADTGTAVLVAEQRSEVLVRSCTSVAVIDRGRVVRSGTVVEVLADASLTELGVGEPPSLRLRRLLGDAGLETPAAEPPS